jgi:hypothetical protein
MNVKPLYKWRIPASNNNSLPVSTVECTASDSIAVLPVDTAAMYLQIAMAELDPIAA